MVEEHRENSISEAPSIALSLRMAIHEGRCNGIDAALAQEIKDLRNALHKALIDHFRSTEAALQSNVYDPLFCQASHLLVHSQKRKSFRPLPRSFPNQVTSSSGRTWKRVFRGTQRQRVFDELFPAEKPPASSEM